VLDRFANIIDQEQIRVALSLELRARCELDLGRVRQAEQLARQAVERTSGMSTRYRYVAATAQIADGRLAAAEATIAAIEREQSARPPGDFTSRKAAEHLHAMIRLARGDLSGAEQAARASLLDPGKQYDIYELGLARILAARQDNQAALDILQRIGDSRRPEDPRLDLELSRRRAALLQLSLTSSEKSQSDAAVIDRLQARWAGSDSGFQPREELLSLSRL
jgi:hypothetical protein